MKNAKIAIIVVVLFGMLPAQSQESIPIESLPVKDHGFYAGGLASTNGLGLNLGYVFGKRLTLKCGVETLSFSKDFSFDEQEIAYNANLDFKTGGIFMMAELFYTRGLYLYGGASLSSFNPRITGEALSGFQYGDIIIPASDVGNFLISAEPSSKIAPYVGTGYRKFLGSNKRVVYNFEIGMYYMGAPKINIEATGLIAPTADPANGQKEYIEKQLEAYTIYPVVKFNLALKLF